MKCGDVEEANNQLRQSKYYDILSKVIASCREGSSIEAAHSELTVEVNNEDNRISIGNISNVDMESSIPEKLIRNSTHDHKKNF